MTRRVLLAGEGKTELGGWMDWAAGNDPNKGMLELGVLEALLNRVSPQGFRIGAAITWRQLPIYRASSRGQRMHKDELNTQALWLKAREKGCDLIAFTRDRDGEDAREAAVFRGLKWLDEKVAGTPLQVVGGVAVECIEAWVLALDGEKRTESLGSTRPKEATRARELSTTKDYVRVIEAADLSKISADASSLNAWLGRARTALSRIESM